jgi:hypothetical protein
MDSRTGLATRHADPGDDGQNPTPVHAYAAAGEKAPRIIRLEDDTAAIECPRCNQQSPVRSNSCPSCGLPFTMEGMNPSVSTCTDGKVNAALAFSFVALPLSFCGGIGIVPGVIACVLGVYSQMGEQSSDRTRAILAVALGALACVISTIVLAEML